jgi:hypothetical protein
VERSAVIEAKVIDTPPTDGRGENPRKPFAQHRSGAAIMPSSALPAGPAPLACHDDRPWQFRRVLVARAFAGNDVDGTPTTLLRGEEDAEIVRAVGVQMRQTL